MLSTKLQSAMEYLMTYGWAILIIAIVLIALFSLGVFSNANLGTSCIAESGFECNGLTLTNIVPSSAPVNSLATLSFTVGQATGADIYNAILLVTPLNTTIISFFGNTHIPYPLSSSIMEFISTDGAMPTFPEGSTNTINIYIGNGNLEVPGYPTVAEEVGPLISSNSIGSPFDGYVWIIFNNTSPDGQRILVERVARITATVS